MRELKVQGNTISLQKSNMCGSIDFQTFIRENKNKKHGLVCTHCYVFCILPNIDVALTNFENFISLLEKNNVCT